ncbi:MAG: ABC transporter ATP-binding protein [Quinella sp. 2Q5]|nr:ABC transporter ATP-binding protein [Quinella sp. 2Q5]
MTAIEFRDVSLSFGRREIFRHATLNLRGGRVIGVVGANGAGKSTLLKLAGKIIAPDAGTVALPEGLTIGAVTPEMKLYGALTGAENLAFFARLRGKVLSPEKIFELGRRVGLEAQAFDVLAENFSTGMRQRLKFAVLLAVDADIWLLDEPTANLDDDGREKFFTEIRDAAPDKIILLATNDATEVGICDEVIRLPL